jgi:subtilisin family serine protease
MAEQAQPEETTGRFLVTLDEGATENAREVLGRTMGVEETVSAEGVDVRVEEHPPEQAVVFERLGVAVVAAPPDKAEEMGVAAVEDKDILHFEPEQILHTYAAEAPGGGNGADLTWGLQAIGIEATELTGEGVEVAVLDTGVAAEHPELAGRTLAGESFIPGEAVEDLHGHGTHCIGTACGSVGDGIRPRYGVAPAARIFAGKVLANSGRGPDTSILAGIEAAIGRGSRVASLSLGSATRPGEPFSQTYERVALRARAAGTLIVAAAGNDSRRPSSVKSVSRPANCPSILAVAAVDQEQAVARFSNRGADASGGMVDIAAPGVDIHSIAPLPDLHAEMSGTSMATPHVAGVAALLAQANPDASPDDLASMLLGRAASLAAPAEDVGAGLLQAPS